MMTWRRMLPVLFVLALAGCRSSDTDRRYLYEEIRCLEDEIYALDSMLNEYEAKLDSAHRQNAALRQQLSDGDGGDADSTTPRTFTPPDINMPSPSGPLEPPGFETNPEELPSAPQFSPPRSGGAATAAPNGPAQLASHDEGLELGNVLRRQEEEITDFRVDHITLNRLLTGGHDRDDHPGDEGLFIVIEPRNRADQVLEVPGELTIVVMDPQLRGPEARVARWDFTFEESIDLFDDSLMARGMHVKLPWPGEPPSGRELRLYVRYVADEGRRLIAESTIQVDPPLADNPVLAGHTVASDQWRRRTRTLRSRSLRRDAIPLLVDERNNTAVAPEEFLPLAPHRDVLDIGGPLLPAPSDEPRMAIVPPGEEPQMAADVPREPDLGAEREAREVAQELIGDDAADVARRRRPQWSPYR